jgi:hypothetical protein
MRLRRIGGTSPSDRSVVYRFTGRSFRNSSEGRSGLYSTRIGDGLLIEPVTAAADTHQDLLLMEDGGTLLQEAA